jgi:hypothetical protein
VIAIAVMKFGMPKSRWVRIWYLIRDAFIKDDNESILIIGNQALSRKLTDLASIVTSGLQRANADSRDQLRQLLLNGQ